MIYSKIIEQVRVTSQDTIKGLSSASLQTTQTTPVEVETSVVNLFRKDGTLKKDLGDAHKGWKLVGVHGHTLQDKREALTAAITRLQNLATSNLGGHCKLILSRRQYAFSTLSYTKQLYVCTGSYYHTYN